MFVVTLDQVHSRSHGDRVRELLKKLSHVPVAVPYERTVGDEIQGIPLDAKACYESVRCALRMGGWHIGIGLGAGEINEGESTRSATGPAFWAARSAVESSKSSPLSLSLKMSWGEKRKNGEGRGFLPEAAADAEAALILWANLLSKRSPAQWEAVELIEAGNTGKKAAAMLGISEQAFSQRRIAAGYEEEKLAKPMIIRLLERAHRASLA